MKTSEKKTRIKRVRYFCFQLIVCTGTDTRGARRLCRKSAKTRRNEVRAARHATASASERQQRQQRRQQPQHQPLPQEPVSKVDFAKNINNENHLCFLTL